jgi:signal peptidase II
MLYLSLLLTALDQVFKHLIPTFNPPIWIIENQVGFELSYNTGAAFSLPISTALTIPISIIVIAIFYHWYKHDFGHHKLSKWVTVLIIAGSLGNLIDRLLFGKVIDFIKIYSWPTFNLADSFITVGSILLIIFYDKIKLKVE